VSTWAGNLIRLARQAKGLSQRELARRAKTSQAAIAAYEAGRRSPSLENLARIIRASGSDLRIRLEALEDLDDWIRLYESKLPPQVADLWRKRDRELVAAGQRKRRTRKQGTAPQRERKSSRN
jgi:transcriptional regulator with XRE-family HTH domain